jgi:uncharacterized membrane protein
MPAVLCLGYNHACAPPERAIGYRRSDVTNPPQEGAMSQELVYERGIEDAKQFARILYLAHAATFFFSLGLFNVLVLIVNYIRRPDTAGTMVYSHHTWMIRSFWWYVVLMAVAFVLMITIIGIPLAWLVGACAWLWMAYRIIRGFLDLNNNKPMPV